MQLVKAAVGMRKPFAIDCGCHFWQDNRGCALLFPMVASALQPPSAADRICSLVPHDLTDS